ncbi:MAG: SO_0444 family Cu/Zn efflux transporter [Candidatus Aadella gelida]|nr:SO_0444 family Cu/Zn efflux transporter [Candidatus Aadella gelida]
MDIIIGIIKESYFLLEKMAPYLLFGFLFAGVLHAFLNTSMIAKHLGGRNIGSVIKASLFGIPLPLCSCSVIPSAMALRKEGASKGAVLSFLISTPTTGVDSIFATYSLLGPLFTVYRVIASFITGTIAGVLSNVIDKDEDKRDQGDVQHCKFCHEESQHSHAPGYKIKSIFNYAFRDLLKDSGKALIVGVIIGGMITFFLPENIISEYLGSGLRAMLIMLILGIPMYVCATASIPIAAALMLKGLAPGAAFVFLVAGPATNVVTMTVVLQTLGKRALAVYLGSIAVGSLFLGWLLDIVYTHFYGSGNIVIEHIHKGEISRWIGYFSVAVLIMLMIYNFFDTKIRKSKIGG